jgi:histidine triad (HIT) family protein
MNDCLFCKISKGDIPSQQEHKDDVCVVFHDIQPKARVHLLIVPHKHIATIMDLEDGDENIIGHMTRIARDVAKKQGLKGYKLQYNVGVHGGQEVMHVHMHLLGD